MRGLGLRFAHVIAVRIQFMMLQAKAILAFLILPLFIVGCGEPIKSSGGGSSRVGPAAFNLNAVTKMPSDYLAKTKLNCRSGNCNLREKTVGLLFIEKTTNSDSTIEVERCSGTLISKTHVLTAGHCVERAKPSSIRFVLPGRAGHINVKSVKAEVTEIDETNSESFEGYPDQAVLELSTPVEGLKPQPVDSVGFDLPLTAVAIVINIKSLEMTWDQLVKDSKNGLEYTVDSIDCRVNTESFLKNKTADGKVFPVIGLYGCPMAIGNSGGALFAHKSQSEGFKLSGMITSTGIAGVQVIDRANNFNEHQLQLADYMSRNRGRGFLEKFEDLSAQKKKFFVTTARRTSCIDLNVAGIETANCKTIGYGHMRDYKVTAIMANLKTAVSRVFEKHYNKFRSQLSNQSLKENLQWNIRGNIKDSVKIIADDGSVLGTKDMLALYPMSVCHKAGTFGPAVIHAFRGGELSRAVYSVGFYDVVYGPWNRIDFVESNSGMRSMVHADYQGKSEGSVALSSVFVNSPGVEQFDRINISGESDRTIGNCPDVHNLDQQYDSNEMNSVIEESLQNGIAI
jgi:hypothetical protein